MRDMKDSGIEWIGKIPASWSTNYIKNLFYTVAGSTPKSERTEYWDGEILWITPADYKTEDMYVSAGKRNITAEGYKSCSTTLVPKNSIIFSKRAPIGTVAINTNELCTNQGCIACVKKEECSEEYYYYVMSVATEHFELLGSGTTFKEISANSFANVKLPFPSEEEQRKIAHYLNNQCKAINALKEDIQSQISSLEEYKRSVITEAVTKGLNTDVEMKDSGIEWIGAIPVHWKCERGKFVLEYLNKPVKEDDGVITCFRDGEVTLRSNRREDGYTVSEKEIGYQGIDIGDLVVHGMDGFAGSIGISDSRGKASPVLNVLDSKENKRYLMYYLRSMAYSDVFLSLATGIRVRSCDLRWNKLAELIYPLPPVCEQNDIVKYIDDRLNRADEIIRMKKEMLATLEQYKKSLIYEYVTGKKEVPNE